MDKTVNVGTIGHVDHGKTTLTNALVRHLLDRDHRSVALLPLDHDGFGHPVPTNRIGKGQRKANKANRWR